MVETDKVTANALKAQLTERYGVLLSQSQLAELLGRSTGDLRCSLCAPPCQTRESTSRATTASLRRTIWREQVTPARRGRRATAAKQESPVRTSRDHDVGQRLKRVFKMDIKTCQTCGGTMRIIACIEDPTMIKRFTAYLENGDGAEQHPKHQPRAPPQRALPGVME